jgi:hypothetical protein
VTAHHARRRVLAVAALVGLLASCSAGDAAPPVTTIPTVTTSSASSTTGTTTTTTVPPTLAPQPDTSSSATQPAQPVHGPGGSDTPFHDMTVTAGGTGDDAWYVFEPASPHPATAPLAIVMHGYYEFDGYDSMYELIHHTVLAGNVVVYPRWQTAVATPCPGPYDIEPCMESAVAGIRGALSFLQADPTRVHPDLASTSYFGFSFGGIITANLANRYAQLGLPEPRAVFLDDPHDGGLTGSDEPAIDDSLAGIPSSTYVICHSGSQGVLAGAGMANASCNALFPKLTSVPADHKWLVMTHPDAHGTPALNAIHGVCAGRPGTADAYDWNFCWRSWDLLRSLGQGDAVGPPVSPDLGAWSDGVAIVHLTVLSAAPLTL